MANFSSVPAEASQPADPLLGYCPWFYAAAVYNLL